MMYSHSKAFPYGPRISTQSPLLSGIQGVAYSLQLAGTGGKQPYAYALVSGTLDSGITLSPGGLLSGVPANAETDTIGLQISDANGVKGPVQLFLLTFVAGTIAATPTFSPVAGTYASAQTVTILDSTPSSTIYYTTDGSTPTFPITGTTQQYSAPITVSASETVKAIATAPGFLTSAVGSAAYTISGGGFLPAGHWVAATKTLQTIYPLTDAVTSTNARHHWAYYDGVNSVQYAIPIVAMGGSYPYVFTLDSGSAALGMSIGGAYNSANYGVLTWTPTGTVTGQTVTVTITDQQLNTTQAVFSISTSASLSHFVFLDALSGSDSTGTGAYATPWQTLSKAFGSTYSASGAGAGAICYLKPTATYPTAGLGYADNDINGIQPLFEMHTTRKPIALVGLGSQPKLNWSSGVQGVAIGNSATDFFLGNLNPDGFSTSFSNQYWVFFGDTNGGQKRFTEFNVTWTNSGYGNAGDSVASPHTAAAIGGGLFRSYIAMVGFTEPSRETGQPGNNYAGHCFYSCEYFVTDGFTINNPTASYDAVCYVKGSNANYELRNHFINVTSAGIGGACTTTGFVDDAALFSTNGEVRYCYLGSGSSTSVDQRIGTQAGTYGTFYLNRNTVIGQFVNAFGGIGNYVNNVVQTTGTAIPPTGGGTASGNVTATSGIINATTLLLQGSALSSVGIAGAQIG
jgi:Chitobiase/beta-hexosaminidase C-terminal domain